MEKKRINFKPYLIAGLIALGLGGGIFCLFYFLRNMALAAAVDGCSYAGIILICISLFILVTRFGFFDFVSYGFKQLGASMFNKQASKYNDFPGYKQEVSSIRAKRSKYYLSILIIGLLFLITGIILLLVLQSM